MLEVAESILLLGLGVAAAGFAVAIVLIAIGMYTGRID